MSSGVIAVAAVTIIGIICAVMLSIAAKLMAVPVDERIPAVRECLPGANCGACGFAGCDGYAAALVEDEGLAVTLCTPGGASVADDIAEVLGREAGSVEKKVAVIHCKGDCHATSQKMDYQGMESCTAAKLLFGGTGSCTFGCMGLGDCAAVCPQDAICIEDGIARVDPRKCIACGLCVKACPNHIISIDKFNEPVKVMCSNKEKGAVIRKKCSAGCLGCGLCMKNCPAGAIKVTNFLATIDHEECIGCGACREVCPVGVIV